MSGRWLIALYPPRWRERYGDEFAELLASQPVRLGMLIDIVAGALDARLRPQPIPGKLSQQGEAAMTSLLKRCAAGGPAMSTREQMIGAAVMLGASFIGAVLYTAASARYPKSQLVDAFGIMIFPLALMLAAPFTYLKDQTLRAKILTIGVTLGILALASYLASLV